MNLPVEVGDDFAHCLGGTGGGGNDVLVGTAAITPGLGAGTIHCLLGGCVCMDCGLQRRVSHYIHDTLHTTTYNLQLCKIYESLI